MVQSSNLSFSMFRQKSVSEPPILDHALCKQAVGSTCAGKKTIIYLRQEMMSMLQSQIHCQQQILSAEMVRVVIQHFLKTIVVQFVFWVIG